MDGVIIDSEGIYLKDQLEFARKKNPDVTIDQLFGMVGATKKDAWEVFARAVNNGQSWEELRDEYRKNNLYSKIDYTKIYRPEVTEVLKNLKSKGYKLAVASSTQLDLVEHVLQVNGIRDYFKIVVSGNQFTRSKPDPEIYCFTADKLGVKAENCLVVEDSTIGITAAKRAGMKIAAVIDNRYGFDQSQADYFLTRVKDVIEAAERA